MDRLEMFRNLMVMAAADGSFTDAEVTYLANRANRLGLASDQFTEALTYALNNQDAEISIPDDHQSRVQLLKELLTMMGADGQVADVEKQLFAVAAARMEIGEDELNEIIDSLM